MVLACGGPYIFHYLLTRTLCVVEQCGHKAASGYRHTPVVYSVFVRPLSVRLRVSFVLFKIAGRPSAGKELLSATSAVLLCFPSGVWK